MITPSDFVRRWVVLEDAAPLVRLAPAVLDGLNLDGDSRRLLIEAGLPEDSAPFLSFAAAAAGEMRTAAAMFGQSDQLDRFYVIGSSDAGSPLCINGETGEVICLDHERAFRSQLLNTSLAALLECLLVYAEFVERVNALHGDEAWLDANIPRSEVTELSEELRAIDASALRPSAYWANELARLGAEAQ